jgi:hypothetical protein
VVEQAVVVAMVLIMALAALQTLAVVVAVENELMNQDTLVMAALVLSLFVMPIHFLPPLVPQDLQQLQ